MNLTDINEIRPLLARHGFRFSKSLGQNFLTAAWVPEEIADSAELDAQTGVLEVGPGIGCLTEQLSRRAGKVVSVELDKALQSVLRETLSGCDNVEVIFADVLKLELPTLMEERFPGMRRVLCANLPYNVTTPLLTRFIESGCFDTVTVMIQREVARRICAAPGTADYGAFGIFVQWHMTAELLFDVPPSCFIPQPKVTSSVIRLKKRKEKPAFAEDEDILFRLVRAAFNQRRKTILNAVSSGFPELSKEQIVCAAQRAGFEPNVRGEVLDIGQYAKFANEIYHILRTDL